MGFCFPIIQFGQALSEKVPHRKFLNDYSKQLLRRFPHMKDEISSMTTFLNDQWQEVESAIVPSSDYTRQTMITGETQAVGTGSKVSFVDCWFTCQPDHDYR